MSIPKVIKKHRFGILLFFLVVLTVENALLIRQNRKYRSELKRAVSEAEYRSPLEMTYKELEGMLAPQFLLESTENKTISLNDLKGNRLVLIFFTTDCPPCDENAETWETAVKKPGYEDAKLIAISPNSMDELKEFKVANDIQFDLYMDADNSLFYQYGIKYVPQVVLIDEDGFVTEINPI